MAAQNFVRLPRAVLKVEGEDRRAFLQGLVSNDVTKLAPDRSLWAAFLTAQGKFLFDLFLTEQDDAILIDVEAARFADFRKRLSLYKLRSKVTITPAEDLAVYAVLGDAPAAFSQIHPDPRLPALGGRALLSSPQPLLDAGLTEAPFAVWDEARIRLGVPDGSRDLPVEKGILLENGFDELGGVDFNKGCYMGQELTARTKYRGLVRKRLLPVTIQGPMPEPGTPVMLGEAEAGEMRSSCGSVGLALLRLEKLRQGGALVCGEAVLAPSVPEWAVLPEGE